MARKHVRTKFNKVLFSSNGEFDGKNLKPGLYRIFGRGNLYVGTFILNSDHTVEFYGQDMIIKPDELSVVPELPSHPTL